MWNSSLINPGNVNGQVPILFGQQFLYEKSVQVIRFVISFNVYLIHRKVQGTVSQQNVRTRNFKISIFLLKEFFLEVFHKWIKVSNNRQRNSNSVHKSCDTFDFHFSVFFCRIRTVNLLIFPVYQLFYFLRTAE